jgi:hypothetical protein
MTELSIEHVLLFVVAAFLLYHLMGSCGCGDGFSVGGKRRRKERLTNEINSLEGQILELKGSVYCNPNVTNPPQMCPGNIECPQCGDQSCRCPDPINPPGGCKGTEFGCCLNGVTPASSNNDECLRKHKCSNALSKCTKECKNHKHHQKCMNRCFNDHKKNCKQSCNHHKNKNNKKHECKNKCEQDCKPIRTDGGAQGACFGGNLTPGGGMIGGTCLGPKECCSVDGYCGKDNIYCLGGYCNSDSECGPNNCQNNECQKIV